MVTEPEIIMAWEAPEFHHYPKNMAWYLTLVILIGLFATYLAVQGDWFGMVSVIIIGGFIGFFGRHEPKIIPIGLTDQGIAINDSLIPYTHIKHFWIISEEDRDSLHIETTAYLNHIITIELAGQDPEIVKAVLVELLPEHPEPEESLAQRIAHRLHF